MKRYPPVSGKTVVRVLCNHFGFKITKQKGSHVKLLKKLNDERIITVVPLHKELKQGTLRGVLKLAHIKVEDFYQYI